MNIPKKRHQYYISFDIAEIVYDILVKRCFALKSDKRDFVNWFYGCQGYHSISKGGGGPHYKLKTKPNLDLEFTCWSDGWYVTGSNNANKDGLLNAQEEFNFLFSYNWHQTVTKKK
jgi:hypothetical protein